MHPAPRRMALAALMTSLPGCGDESEEPSRELYDLAISGDAYKDWSQFPGAPAGLIMSRTHNGDYVRSYMNDIAVAALPGFTGEFPEGTIFVKEQYADAEGKVLNGHTLMWKRPGFDAEHGDWYWVAFNGKGETTTHDGMAPYCYNCHVAAKANDWTYTPFK